MFASAPGAKRYQVDLYLPSTSLDRQGQRTGADTLVMEGLPAAIEQLTGLELVRAQRIWPTATYSVQLTAYPGHGITSKHYLLWGTRKLHIGAVIDTDGAEHELTLLVGEEL